MRASSPIAELRHAVACARVPHSEGVFRRRDREGLVRVCGTPARRQVQCRRDVFGLLKVFSLQAPQAAATGLRDRSEGCSGQGSQHCRHCRHCRHCKLRGSSMDGGARRRLRQTVSPWTAPKQAPTLTTRDRVDRGQAVCLRAQVLRQGVAHVRALRRIPQRAVRGSAAARCCGRAGVGGAEPAGRCHGQQRSVLHAQRRSGEAPAASAAMRGCASALRTAHGPAAGRPPPSARQHFA